MKKRRAETTKTIVKPMKKHDFHEIGRSRNNARNSSENRQKLCRNRSPNHRKSTKYSIEKVMRKCIETVSQNLRNYRFREPCWDPVGVGIPAVEGLFCDLVLGPSSGGTPRPILASFRPPLGRFSSPF